MKKIVPIICFLFLSIFSSAQDNDGMKKHYLKVYDNALKYNDINAAINGLQGYIAIDGGMTYKDTLSMLYFNVKNYYSSLLLGEEVYKAMPDNLNAMARTAECYDELGEPKTAVSLFEQVVPKTKNPYHIYKLAVGQYQLKRTGECELSAKAVLADTTSKRIGVAFTSVDGSSQAIPLNAASTNLLGVLKMDVKNYTAAKKDFEEALKLYPDFVGAKQNLELCDKNLKGDTKPANKPK